MIKRRISRGFGVFDGINDNGFELQLPVFITGELAGKKGMCLPFRDSQNTQEDLALDFFSCQTSSIRTKRSFIGEDSNPNSWQCFNAE